MEGTQNFDPSDPKYKRVRDLPLGEQSKYVDVEGGGFIRADAKKFEEGIHEKATNKTMSAPGMRYENPEVVKEKIEKLKNEITRMEGMFRDSDIDLKKKSREIWAEAIGTGAGDGGSHLDPVEQIEESNRKIKRLKTE